MLAEAKVKNFLQAAVRGEASLPPSVIEQFASDCKEVLEKQFDRNPEWRIRMSGLGHPLCQQVMGRDGYKEEMTYNAILRFLIGDLVECAVVAILKGAGVNIVEAHTKCEVQVSDQHEPVQGTLDLIIEDEVDGKKVWDVKSASPFSFSQKFGKGYYAIKEDDPFGYIMQGHLYAESVGLPFGGWIVVDKSSGEIAFVEAPNNQSEDRAQCLELAKQNVEKLNSDFSFKKPPISPEAEMHSVNGERVPTGNTLLNRQCSFCGYKKICWPDAVHFRKVTSRAKNPPMAWYHKLKVTQL